MVVGLGSPLLFIHQLLHWHKLVPHIEETLSQWVFCLLFLEPQLMPHKEHSLSQL
jgi:hypothetical protein